MGERGTMTEKISMPLSKDAKKNVGVVAGFDPDGSGNINFGVIDPDGGQYMKGNPFVDIDTIFVYNPDKTVQQIIATGLNQTKTTVFTYNPDGTIASIGVVIT
jgi:hypothetical protein